MYTQCPHCQTIFGVSETHLSAAFGRVRCGHCRGQFNARRHLLDELPEQPTQAETPPPVVEEQAIVTAAVESDVEETETNLSQVIPADELDYIDLSSPATEPVLNEPIEEISVEPEASLEIPETATQPPLIKSTTEKEELDAIFASLDQRLEELSEDTTEAVIKPFEEFDANRVRQEDYQDAFGDPDNQTEDDIKASIETIFAAAEAELIKTDIADDSDTNAANEIPLETFLAETRVELLGTDEVEQPEEYQETSAPHSEDVFLTENDNEIENFELATDDNERVILDGDSDEAVAKSDTVQSRETAFEQEELPFALHEDLTTEPHPPRSWLKAIGLFGVIMFLLAAIGFQLALFRNVELANKLPVLKPYLVTFCQYLPCQFTGQRDVKRIQLTSRDVRSHPKDKHTILISAIFVNNAPFDQPYPEILITLSDLTTTVVAQRRFTPQDYLARANAFQLMKSGKPVHISLEVLDPGNDAVNFQFEFL